MKSLEKKELLEIYGGSATEGMNTIQKGYYYVTYVLGGIWGLVDSDYTPKYSDSVQVENKA